VLITGESGVGKEIVARSIHTLSPRAAMPFAPVNCAGLPETLLESELFGHVKGSFTGAYRDKPGKLETAHTGTIFLDEVGEMTLRMQGLLLRFLETGELQKVGADGGSRHVDVRVVAATNRNLRDLIAQGQFRDDLYYRLNVINIHMPPLRDRKEDIPSLVEHFLAKHRYSATAQPAAISEEAIRRLMEYNWPGNVRELENVIERAVVLSRGQIITSRELPFGEHEAGEGEEGETEGEAKGDSSFFKKSVAQFEKDLIMKALRDANGNRSKAAEMLGIYRRLLYAKIKEYGLEGYPPKGR
jgi:transcriptional regulator with PAS, ATPase and Fis domain